MAKKQKLKATTANVLIGFQTRPGIDTKNLIKAGEAKVSTSKKPVKPQGDGYYGLKMPVGGKATIEIFGTKYEIWHQQVGKLEDSSKMDRYSISAWQKRGMRTKLWGQQRHLQLLGYYQGFVDNTKGLKTERSILEFQADYKLRTSGDPDLDTRKKLGKVIKKNKSGKGYIARRTLVRFERAPSSSKVNSKWAVPRTGAPDPDWRGYKKVKTMGQRMYGPVITVGSKLSFRVRLNRVHIEKDAPLDVISSDTSVFKVISSKNLPKGRRCIIKGKAKNIGSSIKRAELKVRYKGKSGKVVIASLGVIVLPMLVRKIRPYWVEIGNTGGTRWKKPDGKKEDYKKVFDLVNSIWSSYGIRFKFLSWRNKKIKLSKEGRISKNPNIKSEFNKIINKKDTRLRSSEGNVINLLIVKEIQGDPGFTTIATTFDALDFSWPNGMALSWNSAGKYDTGNDMAHELGHYLSLANCLDPGKFVHAEDDPSASNKKTDMWSVRKLMYSYNPHSTRNTDKWVDNVGYGKNRRGAMITVRNLPGDKTDNECENSRKHSKAAKFYKKP